ATGNTSIILVPNIEHATIEKARENVDNKNTFKCLLVRLKNEQYEVGLKNEQYEVGFMGENRKNNRQIKLRVSDHEYDELEQTANNFHMSVPAFAKKRAMGYRMKPATVDKSGAIEIGKQLRAIGNNVNQLTKRANQSNGKIEREETQATEKMIARNFKLSKRNCIRYGNNTTRNDWLSESIMQLCGKKSDRKRRLYLDIDYAKSQMKQTRELFSKNDGIQAHHVIQSFKPDEDTAEKANKVGLELAKKLAPNHEVAVYTHDYTNHVHNHIVINSVNFEIGKKYQANGKESIENAISLSDEVCKNDDLSVVKEHNASVRHTLAEQHLLEKNKISWKDELREAIEYARDNSTNFDSFKRHINDVYGVETKLRDKTLSFKHPERERFIRANKLGADYEREGLEHVFAKQIEREQEHERAISRNEGTQRTDEKLYQ